MLILERISDLFKDTTKSQKAMVEDALSGVGSSIGKTNNERSKQNLNLEQEFFTALKSQNQNDQFKSAQKLKICRNFDACISAYRELAKMYPDKRYDCEAQIGEVYELMGETKKAIDTYLAAMVHGADSNTIDNHIWQITLNIYENEQIADTTIKTDALSRYITLFPNGQHAGNAKKLCINIQAER